MYTWHQQLSGSPKRNPHELLITSASFVFVAMSLPGPQKCVNIMAQNPKRANESVISHTVDVQGLSTLLLRSRWVAVPGRRSLEMTMPPD